MNTIILGGDARMKALAALLKRDGDAARYIDDPQTALALLPAADRVLTNCPPKLGMDMQTIMDRAAPGATIYTCGPKTCEGDARVTDLWRDETLLTENAWLTAEGALSAAMGAGCKSIRGLPCAVIGYGRIGTALTEMLVSLGARVTVVSRTEAHRHRAIERGAEAVSMEEMPKADLIFSTPPAMVLDATALAKLDPGTMVIDLASPPYGVDLQAAWDLGLRAWREPGLPGRYCPESAALALREAMRRGRADHD